MSSPSQHGASRLCSTQSGFVVWHRTHPDFHNTTFLAQCKLFTCILSAYEQHLQDLLEVVSGNLASMQAVATEVYCGTEVQTGLRSRLPAAMQKAGIRRAANLARSTNILQQPTSSAHAQLTSQDECKLHCQDSLCTALSCCSVGNVRCLQHPWLEQSCRKAVVSMHFFIFLRAPHVLPDPIY